MSFARVRGSCYDTHMVTTTPQRHIRERGAKQEVRRDMKAWRALNGIWKGKKMPDPIRWQRRIREDRAL